LSENNEPPGGTKKPQEKGSNRSCKKGGRGEGVGCPVAQLNRTYKIFNKGRNGKKHGTNGAQKKKARKRERKGGNKSTFLNTAQRQAKSGGVWDTTGDLTGKKKRVRGRAKKKKRRRRKEIRRIKKIQKEPKMGEEQGGGKEQIEQVTKKNQIGGSEGGKSHGRTGKNCAKTNSQAKGPTGNGGISQLGENKPGGVGSEVRGKEKR